MGAPLVPHQSQVATPQAGNTAANMPCQLGRHREATKRATTGLGRTALEAPQHALTKSLTTPAPLSRLLGLRSGAEGALRVTWG
eukprot:9749302-Alexandrium_andersonii.AAC.1